MNPHPQRITRALTMARAPPPCGSFVRTSPLSEKNSQLHRPFELAASPRSAPLNPERFLNPPWTCYNLGQDSIDESSGLWFI